MVPTQFWPSLTHTQMAQLSKLWSRKTLSSESPSTMLSIREWHSGMLGCGGCIEP